MRTLELEKRTLNVRALPKPIPFQMGLRAIYPAFRVLFPNQVIGADDLAKAIVEVAVRGGSERESFGIREPRHPCDG